MYVVSVPTSVVVIVVRLQRWLCAALLRRAAVLPVLARMLCWRAGAQAPVPGRGAGQCVVVCMCEEGEEV